MKPTAIANIVAQRTAHKANLLADQRAALKTMHEDGQYPVGELTNQRTLVTLFSLVEAGLAQRTDYTFTLTQPGIEMMQRVTQ